MADVIGMFIMIGDSSPFLNFTSGVFNVREEEIRLYRILDITLRQTLGERLFGLGTIHLCTNDQSTPEVDIKRIKHPKVVRTLLSDRAEIERSAKLEGMCEMLGQASSVGTEDHGH